MRIKYLAKWWHIRHVKNKMTGTEFWCSRVAIEPCWHGSRMMDVWVVYNPQKPAVVEAHNKHVSGTESTDHRHANFCYSAATVSKGLCWLVSRKCVLLNPVASWHKQQGQMSPVILNFRLWKKLSSCWKIFLSKNTKCRKIPHFVKT